MAGKYFYISNQLGGIAAIAIRGPLVLQFPLQGRLDGVGEQVVPLLGPEQRCGGRCLVYSVKWFVMMMVIMFENQR